VRNTSRASFSVAVASARVRMRVVVDSAIHAYQCSHSFPVHERW
jgi:hypothetical protein